MRGSANAHESYDMGKKQNAPAALEAYGEGNTISCDASGSELDNLSRLRMQFVMSACGVSPELAAMVAALLFGRAGT